MDQRAGTSRRLERPAWAGAPCRTRTSTRVTRLCVMKLLITLSLIMLAGFPAQSQNRPRARDLGIKVGILPTGPLNAITDVNGVLVGHTTIVQGDNVRTGVTAILPH